MARIKIAFTHQPSFSTTIPVRINDVNYGGHVGNDAILSIIHEARIQFLKSIGYTELNVEGAGIIMADVAIEFKAEAFYGDIITARVYAADFTRVGFDLIYQLEKNNDNTTTIIAVAKTGMVCYDYTLKKVAALLPQAVEKLSNGQ